MSKEIELNITASDHAIWVPLNDIIHGPGIIKVEVTGSSNFGLLKEEVDPKGFRHPLIDQSKLVFDGAPLGAAIGKRVTWPGDEKRDGIFAIGHFAWLEVVQDTKIQLFFAVNMNLNYPEKDAGELTVKLTSDTLI